MIMKILPRKKQCSLDTKIIRTNSEFEKKELCDGLTFSAGLCCVYSCSYCYVPSQAVRNKKVTPLRTLPDGSRLPMEQMVIRSNNPLKVLVDELRNSKGGNRYNDIDDNRVIYASPLVDVAARMDLADETAELVREILDRTNWQVRLLSKSIFLPRIANSLGDFKNARQRVIYGVSSGTLDDALAKAVERGCPPPSKRLQSIRELQEAGHRTYGMICPSLPMAKGEYLNFSLDCKDALTTKTGEAEHVWAEVINLRGKALSSTVEALRNAGKNTEADRLQFTFGCKKAQFEYAKLTHKAHLKVFGTKLRFLQYVTPIDLHYWQKQRGVISLGKALKIAGSKK